jgi:hypothetical protein
MEFEAAITLDRNETGAFYHLGVTLMLLGQPAAAIPHIEKAIRLNPHDPNSASRYWESGLCCLLLGDVDRARRLVATRPCPSGSADVRARSLRGRSPIPESLGSQLTRRWRRESGANPSLKWGFSAPLNYGNSEAFMDDNRSGKELFWARKGGVSVFAPWQLTPLSGF